MSDPLRTYSFLYPATVMLRVTAPTEADADAQRAEMEGGEIELTVRDKDGKEHSFTLDGGHQLTALTLESGGSLDQVDGIPLDDLCRNTKCRDEVDGDGWDGECGNCADRRYSHEEGEHQDAPREDCAACNGD
jgi:hypothetical protein